ncbi:DAHP synthetase [Atractiella rhizophila]|nr:DAHP synthetase [Atractiella rhizophila]
MSAPNWTPDSWRSKKILQDVVYPPETEHKLPAVTETLRKLPPLVSNDEIERLRQNLAQVAAGKAFLLQGGDCAELFDYCTPTMIESKLKLLLAMSLIIIYGARLPVVRILRGAGQYAKPRSKPTEVIPGVGEVLSFRGDNVNGFAVSERTPDPSRLTQSYFHSSSTLNYMRSLLSSPRFASLHHPLSWSLSHVRSPALQQAFERIVDNLTDALDFIDVVGGGGGSILEKVEVWTSHEGLLLEYEEALTRPMEKITQKEKKVERKLVSPYPLSRSTSLERLSNSTTNRVAEEEQNAWYNVSAHFLWIGDRTRQLDGAHVEYFRGIRNPIGIKVGPSMAPSELIDLLKIVDPDKEPGRVTLICRFGKDKVESALPPIIRAVKESEYENVVIWSCDPMHGNTKSSEASPDIKTRHMADMVSEISSSFRIHLQHSSRLSGIHLELTGETNEDGFSVTECLGGSMELLDEDLSLNYQTYCDPRMNYEQSLDVAFLISHYFQNERRGKKMEDLILHNLTSATGTGGNGSRGRSGHQTPKV